LSIGWILLGEGLVFVGTGVLFDLTHADLWEDQALASQRGDVAEYNRLQSQIDDARTIDWVLYGVGVSSIAVAAAWFLLDAVGEDEPVPQRLSESGTVPLSWTW
jgi:hypothetical protein